MRPVPAFFAPFALAALASSLSGCPKPTDKPVETEIQRKDEWDSIPRTPEWLHATSDFSGDRKAECEEVLKWVEGEAECKTSMCVHGRDLAREWVARCPKLVPASADKVKAISEKLATSADEPPTACGKDIESILSKGCGADTTCEVSAQVWATKCGKTEGTPLIVRLLERTVERRLSEPGDVTLDARSCEELRVFMAEGMACAQQFACQDMLKRVEMYRTRCERDERPLIGTAMIALAITAGAQQAASPIGVQPTPSKVTTTDIPLPLADGSGAALMVCNERPADLAKYVAGRRACEGGSATFAKAFVRARDLEVRMATLEFPKDDIFLARFPSLDVAGERELRDKEELTAIEADLGKAVSLAQSGSTLEAAFELFKTTMAHVSSIRRSPQLRAAFTSRDEALAPALRELGKAKAAVSSRGRLSSSDFVVFVNRATARAFGDFSMAFSVEPGFVSRALTLDTQSFMPKATEAYLDALKPVIREASKKRVDAKVLHDTTVRAYDLAKACGAAEQAHRDAEQALLRCVFAVEPCDSSKIEALTKANDDSRAAAESAHLELHIIMTGPAVSARAEIEQAMLARECNIPVW